MKFFALGLIAAILVGGGFYLMNKSSEDNFPLKDPREQTQTQTQSQTNKTTMENGLQIEDTKVGEGTEVKAGNTVTVHYTGTLTNGVKFDSSLDRGTPFSFTIGQGQVIQGWEQGLLGMKVGGKRKLTIPASLGYGSQTIGGIPANSTLMFEIELLDVK